MVQGLDFHSPGIDSQALIDLLTTVQGSIHRARDELTQLDIAIGDGDHGITMDCGWKAIVDACVPLAHKNPGSVLKVAAASFLKAVGATVGPLYATGFLRMAQMLGARTVITGPDTVLLFEAFVQGLLDRGHAVLGDKTMMDVWIPAMRAFREEAQSTSNLSDAARFALQAACQGLEATRNLAAKTGRASRLGARSVGAVDPGALSAYIIFSTTVTWLDRHFGVYPMKS